MWISVKDGFPENICNAVLKFKDGGIFLGRYSKYIIERTKVNGYTYKAAFFVTARIINQIPIEEDFTHEVTHYIEIPELLEQSE